MRIARATGPARIDLLPTAEDVAFAHATTTASPLLSRCAVVRASSLDRGAARIWLALECLQVTGSFKVRGALTGLARLKAEGVSRVVAASAGNHGGGVARIAPMLGMTATIVVPETAPKKKVDAIRAAGATIIVHGDGYDAAEVHALALAASSGEPYLSPYDDVNVIAGNGGSLAMDIASVVMPSVVFAPFGGGGMATGIACGLSIACGEAYGETRRVWGIQGERSPAFALSLAGNSAVESLPPARTLADGLEGGLSVRAFARAAGVTAGVVVVTEEQIAAAMRFAFRELGLVLEGSAAAALAPVLAGLPGELDEMEGDLVCVLSGRNVDAARLLEIVC